MDTTQKTQQVVVKVREAIEAFQEIEGYEAQEMPGIPLVPTPDGTLSLDQRLETALILQALAKKSLVESRRELEEMTLFATTNAEETAAQCALELEHFKAKKEEEVRNQTKGERITEGAIAARVLADDSIFKKAEIALNAKYNVKLLRVPHTQGLLSQDRIMTQQKYVTEAEYTLALIGASVEGLRAAIALTVAHAK